MRIEEIGHKIQRLKSETQTLRAEIEKVNSQTKRMTHDLHVATRHLNQLPPVIERPESRIRKKDDSPEAKYKLMMSDYMLGILNVDTYNIGLYTLEMSSKALHFKDEVYPLTRKEFLLLALFAANQNVFIEREVFLTNVWKENNYKNSRSMDVYICKMRKLLQKDININIVNTHAKGFIMSIGKFWE
jgi:uncharacterized protein (UPF0335 family)